MSLVLRLHSIGLAIGSLAAGAVSADIYGTDYSLVALTLVQVRVGLEAEAQATDEVIEEQVSFGRCSECTLSADGRVVPFGTDVEALAKHPETASFIRAPGSAFVAKTNAAHVKGRYSMGSDGKIWLEAVQVANPSSPSSLLTIESLSGGVTYDDWDVSSAETMMMTPSMNVTYVKQLKLSEKGGLAPGVEVALPGGLFLKVVRWKATVAAKLQDCGSVVREGSCGGTAAAGPDKPFEMASLPKYDARSFARQPSGQNVNRIQSEQSESGVSGTLHTFPRPPSSRVNQWQFAADTTAASISGKKADAGATSKLFDDDLWEIATGKSLKGGGDIFGDWDLGDNDPFANIEDDLSRAQTIGTATTENAKEDVLPTDMENQVVRNNYGPFGNLLFKEDADSSDDNSSAAEILVLRKEDVVSSDNNSSVAEILVVRKEDVDSSDDNVVREEDVDSSDENSSAAEILMEQKKQELLNEVNPSDVNPEDHKYRVGDRVRVRDTRKEDWMAAVVTRIRPVLGIKVLAWRRSFQWNYVYPEPLQSGTAPIVLSKIDGYLDVD